MCKGRESGLQLDGARIQLKNAKRFLDKINEFIDNTLED